MIRLNWIDTEFNITLFAGHWKGEEYILSMYIIYVHLSNSLISRHIVPPIIKQKLFEGIKVLDVG